jgi:hypothetical protein
MATPKPSCDGLPMLAAVWLLLPPPPCTRAPARHQISSATIVDAQTGSTNYSKTYSQSTTQVLKIVTGSTNMPASGAKYTGVFFPNGLNGLRTLRWSWP